MSGWTSLSCLFCATAILLLSSPSLAQTITVNQAMSFGEGVVMDNTAPRSIILEADGDYTIDPEFLMGTLPVPGIYTISGLTPNIAITSVTMTVDQQMIGPGPDFTIDNFDIDFPPNADPLGDAEIRVGARMRTDGSGSNYTAETTFEGEMTLTVNY